MWLASRRHQFNEIKMIKCGSLSYLVSTIHKMWLPRPLTVTAGFVLAKSIGRRIVERIPWLPGALVETAGDVDSNCG